MAFLLIKIPRPKLYSRYMLHGLGPVDNDATFRNDLRLMAAVLLAQWYDEKNTELTGKISDIFDVATTEQFYKQGYAKTTNGENDTRLWFCSYIGFERSVKSAWVKKNCPDCRGYISMHIYNQDIRHNHLDSHVVQIYF